MAKLPFKKFLVIIPNENDGADYRAYDFTTLAEAQDFAKGRWRECEDCEDDVDSFDDESIHIAVIASHFITNPQFVDIS